MNMMIAFKNQIKYLFIKTRASLQVESFLQTKTSVFGLTSSNLCYYETSLPFILRLSMAYSYAIDADINRYHLYSDFSYFSGFSEP